MTAKVEAPAPPLLVAVVGNPNTGKSTLFNRLTGARQQIGNYPGITVERKRGSMALPGNRTIDLLDLPGTYSLAACSEDEQIVFDVLTGRVEGEVRPKAVICVVDATNLRRNLFLASQVAETGMPVVVALNMSDAAERRRVKIDAALLSKRIGVPVVPTVAASGQGIEQLRGAVARMLDKPAKFTAVVWPTAVVEAAAAIEKAALADGVRLLPVEARRLLFDVDSALPDRIGWDASASVEQGRARLREAGLDPVSVEAVTRYRHLEFLLDGVATEADVVSIARSYRVDRLLTHRFWGLIIFLALMFGVFSSIYWLAQPAMEAIESAFARAGAWTSARLETTPMLRSLVVDGALAGVAGVVIFLPQILILFFFIAILEDTGYMARAAFLMDKVFSWTGLNGKSFVPMLSSFACAVPAILGTRTIEDRRARLSTILVAPLMSCSARLPVYVLMIGAFIQPVYGKLWAGAALFAMHLLGLVVAIPIAFVINRFLLKLKTLPFLLEMPPYRLPRVRDVAWRLWRNGSEFVTRAGTVILAFSIVIWALTYFPRPATVREEVAAAAAAREGIPVEKARDRLDADLAGDLRSAYLEQSWLGRFGKRVQPAFEPAGFDWKITVGVLASFPAREVIVSTLGIIYNVSDEEMADGEESPALRSRLASATWPDGRPVYTPAVAIAIMVFFAFCLQCGSTVAVIARESGWGWATFAFVYMTALAWGASIGAYRLGLLIPGGGGAA